MAGLTVWVTSDFAMEGADLVSGGSALNVKKGVELLLLNNHFVEGAAAPARGQCDVSVLLRQGLEFLSKSPYETLGVQPGCKTPEIRKAFKRAALKYHPDKNPKTTPLFQLMNAACDKLTDPAQRQREERTAAAKQPKPPKKPPPPAAPPSYGAGPGAAGAGAAGKQSFDPRTGQWSSDAEWGKYQNGAPDRRTEAATKAQDAARRKQYYDEILREQFKKAESDRKAKEYAKQRAQGAAAQAGAAQTRHSYDEQDQERAGNPGNLESKSSRSSASSGFYNRPPPPTEEVPNRYGHYKANADGHSQNVPPGSDSFPDSARAGYPSSGRAADPSPRPYGDGGQPKASAPAGYGKYTDGSGRTQNNSSSNNLRSGIKPSANRVPKPYGLRCLFIGTNAAELEWVTSKYHRNTLLAELSWRAKEAPGEALKTWESASKLIGSGKCRKKNLIPGSVYDFRVRAVEELSGGLLGYRSDWSDAITITLMPDRTTNSKSNSNMHSLHSKGSFGSTRLDPFAELAKPETERKEKGSVPPSAEDAAKLPDPTAKRPFERFKRKPEETTDPIKADAAPFNHAQPEPIAHKEKSKEKEGRDPVLSAANKEAWGKMGAGANKPSKWNGKDYRDADLEVEEDIVTPKPSPKQHESAEAKEVDDDEEVIIDDNSSVDTTFSRHASRATAGVHKPPAASKHEHKGDKNDFTDFTIEVEDDDDEEDEEDDFEEDEDEEERTFVLLAPASKVKGTKSNGNLSFYSHPVRSEPTIKSAIVGYLVAGRDVTSCAAVGEWLKVKIHKPPKRKNSKIPTSDVEVWGWSVQQDKTHEFLKLEAPTHMPSMPSTPHMPSTAHSTAHLPSISKAQSVQSPTPMHHTPSTPLLERSGSLGQGLGNRSMHALPKNPSGAKHAPSKKAAAREVQVWMELFDPEGHAYYFHEASGESKWEPPEWVEESDASGAKYYVNLGAASSDPTAPLHSTWTQPEDFAKLLRGN